MRGIRNAFNTVSASPSGERGGVSPPVKARTNRGADAAPLAGCVLGGVRRGAMRRRTGFTIAEILLVLAVLVVISGLIFPPVLRLMADQPLKDGAERARSQLANVRFKALDSNTAWQFRFEPGGRHYLWVPQESAASTATANGATNNGSTATTMTSAAAVQSGPQTGELPKGIVFAADMNGVPFGVEHIPAELVMGSANAYELTQVAWSVPLTFRPDGSAADSELAVVDARNKQMRLIVRGLTGGVVVTPMETRTR